MIAVLEHDSKTSAQIGVQPLVVVLQQLADLLHATTDEQYAMKPVGVVNSSMGGHVRHCLDHVESLLMGLGIAAINYDDRRRGTDVETNRRSALRSIVRLENALAEVNDWSIDEPLRLTTLISADGPPILVETSLGRELAFVLSHTVHHNALIGVIANLLGIAVPERFGYAPSTVAHLEKIRCAQ